MQITKKKKIKTKRLITLITIIIFMVGLICGVYYGLGLDQKFSNEEELRRHLEAFGSGYGIKFMFILINFVQTTLIPVSNIPTIYAGTFIFGRFETAVLTNIGVLFGSVVSFAFGKLFGKKAVYWIVDNEVVDHYLNLIKGKEKYVVFLMLLFPGFPDDIICMIAGITPMTWLSFLISIMVTRTIPNFMIAYFGAEIPIDSVWGIVIVAGMIVLFLVISRLIVKNWNTISRWIDRFDNHFKRRKKIDKTESDDIE